MINHSDQPSNQYGFYAVPKALEPKKKYRETYEDERDDEDQEEEPEDLYETLEYEPENQKQLQRDYYVDEALYPDFKPKERGLDYGVQIEREDLFDFDLEVRPLVEILVGKSVVTAINELQEEKEKNQRAQALDKYQKKRNAELMVTQRLEAQSKRKKEEVDRRKLQKELYVKNSKQAAKKIISRRNAKHSVLNLKTEVLQELEQDGFLREETYLTLRIDYEGWLYEQIKKIMAEEQQIHNQTESMMIEEQRQAKKEHKKAIEKQSKRRKQILDERERIKKENELRKMKKKIRKERLQISKEREEKAEKAVEEVHKHAQVAKVLRAKAISNGLTNKRNSADTVHIAGGLFNFVVTYLMSTGIDFSSEQIEEILSKLLDEVTDKIEIQFSEEHFQKISEVKKKMEENPINFMKNKEEEINGLLQQISLDISLFEQTRTSISSTLHTHILATILNIWLNCLPEPQREGEDIRDSYEPMEKDKKRQSLAEKLKLVAESGNVVEKMKNSESVVRVRFERIRSERQEQGQPEKEKESKEEQTKEIDLDEWINIYDGCGWEQTLKEDHKPCDRSSQTPTSYVLTSFENSLVVDERNLHYLQEELLKLWELKAGEQLDTYKQGLTHIRTAQDNVPIYDIELEWESQ